MRINSVFCSTTRRLLAGTVVASLVMLMACGGGAKDSPTGPPIIPVPVLTTVTVSLTVPTILVGQTAVASVAGLDQNGSPIAVGAVTWSSSAPLVATVNTGGTVTGIAAGQTQITATSDGKRGTAVVQVNALPITLSGMWTGITGSQVLSLTLLENAGNVSGNGTLSNTPSGLRALTVSGIFNNPTLTAAISSGAFLSFNLQGTFSSNTIVSTLAGAGFSGEGVTLNRAGSSVANASLWTGTYSLSTVNGLPLPASFSLFGYATKVFNRSVTLAADGTGMWTDSTSSGLFCGPGAPSGMMCDASGRASVAWIGTNNTLQVVRSVTTGYVAQSKTFIKQPDGSLLKTDDSETEVYKRP